MKKEVATSLLSLFPASAHGFLAIFFFLFDFWKMSDTGDVCGMNGKSFALLLIASLLALSVLLFGCLQQGGTPSTVNEQIQPLEAQDLIYTDEPSAFAQDLNDLEINESEWTS